MNRSATRCSLHSLVSVHVLLAVPAGLDFRAPHADDEVGDADLLGAAEPIDDTGEHGNIDGLVEWWV